MKYLYYVLCKKLTHAFLLFLLFTSLSSAQIEWTRMPQPYGGAVGRMYAIGDTILAPVSSSFYISTNGGTSWIPSGVEASGDFSCFVHTNNNIYLANCRDGLYKSTDLFNWTYYEYGEYEYLARDSAGIIYALKGSTLYMSTDSLETVQEIFYLNYPDVYFPMIYCKGGYVFLTGRDGKIYRKYNSPPLSGEWDTLQTTYNNPIQLTSGPGSSIYSLSDYPEWIGITYDYGETWRYIELDKLIPDIEPYYIYVSDSIIIMSGYEFNDSIQVHLYRSTDSGRSWHHANNGLTSELQTWQILPVGKDLLLGTGAGPYKSTDKGESWFPSVKGMNRTEISSPVFTDEGVLFAVVSGQGVMRSTDQGNTWRSFNKGLRNVYCWSLVMDPDGDLFVINYGKIYRLADHHQDSSWISTDAADVGYSKLWVDPTGRLYAINGNTAIYRNSDDGNTWQNIFANIGDPTGITISDQGNFFVTTANARKIYKSVNDGITWSVSFQHPIFLWDIKTDVNGNLYAGTHDGTIIRSTNEGADWTMHRGALTDYHIDNIFTDSSGNIYCSAWKFAGPIHFFRSTDLSDTWERLSGTNDIDVHSIDFQYNKIYLFTNKGLLVTSALITSNDELNQPEDFTLRQNYPNPFNPSTNISYSVRYRSFVSVKVYDILGTEAAVLVNEVKEQGSYEVNWNASSLPSGVYFCRLKTNGAVITKKMTLIK